MRTFWIRVRVFKFGRYVTRSIPVTGYSRRDALRRAGL